MKRALRWIRRIVVGASLLVVLAVGIAVLLAHTDWGRNKIRAKVVEQLQAEFPGSTIRSLSGSPFGTIVLHDITLLARDGKPLVTVAELRVEASLRPLFSKRVQVDSLGARGVHVFAREQPPMPPSRTPAAPSEPSTWTIELPAIAVDDARVTMVTASGTEVLDELVVRASVRIPAGEPLAATADVLGQWRGKPFAVNAMAAVDGPTTRVPFATVRLADASVIATGVEVRETQVIGAVHAEVPAALVRELAKTEIPGDIVVTAHASGAGAISIDASVGAAHAQAELVMDLAARRAKGIVTAHAPDLAAVTRGKATGAGTVVAALSADQDRVRGVITVSGTVARPLAAGPRGAAEPRGAGSLTELSGTTTFALDATRKRVELVASADTTQGSTVAHAVAEAIGADAWSLVDSDVRARARNVEGVRDVRAVVNARGPLWPAPQLAFEGAVDALGYQQQATAIAAVHATVRGVATKDTLHAETSVTATGIRSGKTRIPSAAISAEADVGGGLITAALGAHRVRTADGASWTGSGGRVTVTDHAIVLDHVRTGTGAKSRVTASGRFGRIDKSITAKVTARDVALAIADPTLGGTVDADLDVSRRGVRWGGTANIRARGVAMPDRPTVDANLDVKLVGRKVTVDGNVTSSQLGTTTLAVAVTGPADITDGRGWQRLPRTAIEQVKVAIAGFDAASVGGTGIVNGELALGPTDVRGEISVRGVATKGGPVDATISLEPGKADAIALHAVAQMEGLPHGTADAVFVLPARPFDPVAWEQLGRRALREATIKTETIHVDPALLARFGIESPYSADIAATITADEGARTIGVSTDVRRLAGGELTVPVDLDIDGAADDSGMHAEVRATSGAVTAKIDAKSPFTLERVLDPKAPPAPITATIEIPDTRARDLLSMLGETDALAGIVGGSVTVTGTVAEPDIRAKLAVRGFAMKASSITNKKPPTLELLEIDARYTRERVELRLTGNEGKDRLIEVRATGNPGDPRAVVASIEAANFDLAPLLAFGTSQVRAGRGTLSGSLKIKGLDPKTGSVRGQLVIRDGRVPLSPELGTLRRATLTIDVIGQRLEAAFEGRVGAGGGSITGKLTSELQGGVPQSAHLDMKIRKVSPIGALQPRIDADLVGDWASDGELWQGTLKIRNGKIVVPPETGTELLMTGAPSDMVFVDKQLVAQKGRRPPTKPFFISKIVIGNTDVDLQDEDARVRLTARGNLTLEVGDGIGLKGQITTVKGNVELFGRRYQIEQGVIDYDGTTDPRLDIRITHEFKNLTLALEVGGRASKPDPRPKGDRGNYTDGQLWSFLLGAEPGDDDSGAQAGQAVVSGSLSVLSGRLGQKVNKYLPVRFKLDSINYEAETASSSKAVRFGIQLSPKTYLVYRQRLAARPDENPGEAVVEYQFRPNFLFEGTIGERNKGGDFLWRKRW